MISIRRRRSPAGKMSGFFLLFATLVQAGALVVVLMFLWLSGSGLRATQVDWNGLPFSTNLTSTGQAWDDGWVAELGSFQNGFMPTAANTADWAGKWRAASRSVYSVGSRYFGGTFVYESNPTDFPTGRRAYLWIFSPMAPQGEWLLLTNPAWSWPQGSPFDFFPVNWASSQATEAVVGQLSGPGWDLKSGSVTGRALPPLPFSAWLGLYFTTTELANQGLSGPDADADGDGFSNFLEYAGGTLPRKVASMPKRPEPFLLESEGAVYGAARWPRSTRVQGFIWGARVADDLSGGPAGGLSVVSNLPWEWTVRRLFPVTEKPRGFFRFSLEP